MSLGEQNCIGFLFGTSLNLYIIISARMFSATDLIVGHRGLKVRQVGEPSRGNQIGIRRTRTVIHAHSPFAHCLACFLTFGGLLCISEGIEGRLRDGVLGR